MSYFAFIQPDILSNLFKTYCCSCYGSILWHYNSHGFDKYGIEKVQWNKSVRKIFSLPYTAQRWLLCPLMGQYHINYQLYMKDILMINMFIKNTLVQECLHNAIYDATTVIGYKL